MIRENIPAAIKGAGALAEALDLIGTEGKTDHDMARIIHDNELVLRDFLKWGLHSLATDH
jgi:hypothetical protein